MNGRDHSASPRWLYDLLGVELDRLEAAYEASVEADTSAGRAILRPGLTVFSDSSVGWRRILLDFFAVSVARSGRRVAYLTDTGQEATVQRILSVVAGVPLQSLANADFNEHGWTSLATTIGQLAELPLMIEQLTIDRTLALLRVPEHEAAGTSQTQRPEVLVVGDFDGSNLDRAQAIALVELLNVSDDQMVSALLGIDPASSAAQVLLNGADNATRLGSTPRPSPMKVADHAGGGVLATAWAGWLEGVTIAGIADPDDASHGVSRSAEQREMLLRDRIVGQDAAVAQVAARLHVASALRLSSATRPLGSFLFAGPTGCGKTLLGKVLADVELGDPDAVIRIDLSEFSERTSASKLIGPPPGYVGFSESDAWLTTKITTRPRSVVIFDELEKADRGVWNLLLQILEEGQLTDGKGHRASFESAIIVMTTNLGHQRGARHAVGFGSDASTASLDTRRAVDKALPRELVGRIDEVVIFEPLSQAALVEIAHRYLDELTSNLAAQGYDADLDEDSITEVADTALRSGLGARAVYRELEIRLAAQLSTRPDDRADRPTPLGLSNSDSDTGHAP